MNNIISNQIYRYLVDLYDNYFLEELRIKAEEESIPIIKRESESILITLIKIAKPKKILELGTAVGFSTMLLRKYSNADITSIELSKDNYRKAIENISKYDEIRNYNLINEDAKKALKNLDQGFDFVFIDCDKSHYKEYFDLADKLISKGSIIVCDNVLFKGYVANDDIIDRRMITIVKRLREFLAYITNLKNYSTTIIPIGDGLSVSVKED